MENINTKSTHERKVPIEQTSDGLNTLSKKLQIQKMDALADLAGIIAHDFNNILQSLLGFTQLIKMRKKSDDPDYKNLTQLEGIIRNGSELTHRLLTFGQRIDPIKSPVNLNNALGGIDKRLPREVFQNIAINMNLAEDIKPVNADLTQIDHVLTNLALNAAEAMPNGGTLTFNTENVLMGERDLGPDMGTPHDEFVCLSVSDTGHGMSQEILEHMYEPFFTTKDNKKGSGLGLSIVYAILKNHGGFLDCTSVVGEGTTFKVYFPLFISEST